MPSQTAPLQTWPSPPPDLPHARRAWLQLLLLHQRRSWPSLLKASVEDYIERYWQLREDSPAVAALAANEAYLRRQSGDPASLEEYLERLPEHRTALYEAFTGVTSPQLPAGSGVPGGPPAIPGYVILEELGRGGMGIVYRALDTLLSRVVALKVMRDDVLPSLRRRFAAEARAMARLGHPNVAQIYSAGEHEGAPYLVMKLIPGGTLAGRRQPGGCDPVWSTSIIEKVARAVDYLHERRILHRDLKPSNILLDEEGEPHVADFGIAKILDEHGETTASGVGPGTPAYMAPEQVRGESRRIGPASEVWTLGVILYELLTGRRPFEGPGSLALAVTMEPHPPLRSLCPQVCPRLEAIVHRCLHKLASRRYQSAAALADDLRGWLDSPPGQLALPLEPSSWPLTRRSVGAVCLSALGLGSLTAVVGAAQGDRPQPKVLPRPPAVPLIDGQGEPLLGEWVVGAGRRSVVQGELRLETGDLGLFELAAATPGPDFRFEAELLHDVGPRGVVGLYAGRRRVHDPHGEKHVFLRLDLTALRATPAYFGVSWHATAGGDEVRKAALGALPRRMLAPPGTWHKLTLLVRRGNIRAYLDGQVVGAVTFGALRRQAERLGDVDGWGMLPASGLGLLLDRASATFRRIVLQPEA
jgi:serine/threonine protein kinase